MNEAINKDQKCLM